MRARKKFQPFNLHYVITAAIVTAIGVVVAAIISSNQESAAAPKHQLPINQANGNTVTLNIQAASGQLAMASVHEPFSGSDSLARTTEQPALKASRTEQHGGAGAGSGMPSAATNSLLLARAKPRSFSYDFQVPDGENLDVMIKTFAFEFPVARADIECTAQIGNYALLEASVDPESDRLVVVRYQRKGPGQQFMFKVTGFEQIDSAPRQ